MERFEASFQFEVAVVTRSPDGGRLLTPLELLACLGRGQQLSFVLEADDDAAGPGFAWRLVARATAATARDASDAAEALHEALALTLSASCPGIRFDATAPRPVVSGNAGTTVGLVPIGMPILLKGRSPIGFRPSVTESARSWLLVRPTAGRPGQLEFAPLGRAVATAGGATRVCVTMAPIEDQDLLMDGEGPLVALETRGLRSATATGKSRLATPEDRTSAALGAWFAQWREERRGFTLTCEAPPPTRAATR